MRLNIPTLQELPSVHVALGWLLDVKEGSPAELILSIAQAAKLILPDGDPHWTADGEAVLRLAEAGIEQLPADAERLGQLLHGLGEIRAHCHAQGLSELIACAIEERKALTPLARAFEAAIECNNVIRRQTRVDELSLGQWISHSTPGRETFQLAVARLGHPDRVFGGYGLTFVTRIVLKADPSVVDDWISANPDDAACSVIGGAALSMVFPFDEDTAVQSLLRSSNVAIKYLGAAAVVFPVGVQEPMNLRDCHRTLINSGFTAADAIWMAAVRIREAVYARNRSEHGRQQNAARLGYIERVPEKAIGGLRYAVQEMERLREQIERNAADYEKLVVTLEQLLVDTAADWPTDGLNEQQMEALDSVFVDAADVRHRLAVKVSHQANRAWLLKRNVELLRTFIGLECDPGAISKDYFSPEEASFGKIADWAAQSAVLLYQSVNRGVGKSTSDLVSGIASASNRITAIPFASSRHPDAWQSVITRAACAMRFVFRVVASVPEDQRESVAQLNGLALTHSLKLLCVRNLPKVSEDTVFRLANEANFYIERTSEPDKIRELWALNENLDSFSRTLALWSSSNLVDKHTELACRLFGQVCVVPLSRDNYNLQMSRMVSMLDAAIACCIRSGNAGIVSRIKEMWSGGYRDWMPISPRWETMAEKFARAIETDGPERAEVVADETLARTQCRRVIDDRHGV
ncbi:hypothetical protein [Paraburkholderia sp. BCC1876]|uniref:hypothetical protein n=1 Tax=Paraburkholderia sp. BCC1876 TaxID=2676303 RepID=UPI001591479C|nr:hypothetical protein [Paraburkholderia sp. BCC1876]